MTKNLVIVESPAKAKTIEKFLGKDFTVRSSYGHIRDLPAREFGVDIKKGFAPQYQIADDKKQLIADLKKMVKQAEMVWLASDEDREGEAIAWHLSEALELDKKKTKRIVFHEITKQAIEEAIKNPRNIDMNLVDAQQARRVLDRLVGFELSPLLWKKVKPSLSAGRVQSVAVRLIVEREREVKAFNTASFFKVSGIFLHKDSIVKADLSDKFDTYDQALKFLEKCKKAKFTIESTEVKPSRKSPSPPFTTSTLQQEASRKLGFSVSRTMTVAQQLYESGYITYMRTDSVNLSTLALTTAKTEITKLFGANYVHTRNFTTKTKGAQEAHEAIRPSYISNQTIDGNETQQRLYDLIWKRTIASQMSDAELEKTQIQIGISTANEKFIAKGEVIKFDGFLKIYMESSDEEDEENGSTILPAMKVGEELLQQEASAVERFTKHAPRYTEASLVKKLEELGIGRPSTYAPTISTIQKRAYITNETREGVKRDYKIIVLKNGKITDDVKSEITGFEKSKLFPTDIGMIVTDFLYEYFNDVLDYHFTASVEMEFDEVAQGNKKWNKIIEEFYGPFHKKIEDTNKNSEKASGERLLGIDPKTKKNVYVKIGKYGAIVQIGERTDEEKPLFASLKKGQSIEDISLEDALILFSLPKELGDFEGKPVKVAIGKFGPYVVNNGVFCSIGKTDDPYQLELPRAIEIILAKRDSDSKKVIQEFEGTDLRVLNGRWGAYISFNKQNYKLPKGTVPEKLTLKECEQIVATTDEQGGPKKSFRGKKVAAKAEIKPVAKVSTKSSSKTVTKTRKVSKTKKK